MHLIDRSLTFDYNSALMIQLTPGYVDESREIEID